jgi:hypothetical protein
MVARVLAGACGVALAASLGSGAVEQAMLPARLIDSKGESAGVLSARRPVVLKMSVPLPLAGDPGYASFSTRLGGRDLHFAATWSGGEGHRRLAVVLASRGED